MNYFWSVVLEKKIIFRIVQKISKNYPSIYKGSTLILPNCVGSSLPKEHLHKM